LPEINSEYLRYDATALLKMGFNTLPTSLRHLKPLKPLKPFSKGISSLDIAQNAAGLDDQEMERLTSQQETEKERQVRLT
jgi:hypothetical protein